MSSSGICPSLTDQANKEMNKYLKLKRLELDEDPLNFWRINKDELPLLSKLSKIYLSPPPSSSASEREFKISKSIQKDRIRLLPKNVETLLFLKYNLRALKYTTSFPEVPKDFIPPNSVSVIENEEYEVEENDLIDFCGFD